MLLENEDLTNYETERRFISSPYNKSTFYIPGKGITVDENGNIHFYFVDDINDFVYGQDIESEYLIDDYQLTVEEKSIINQLRMINAKLNNDDISAVYMRYKNGELYYFITMEQNPECFYKVSVNNLDRITKEILPEIQPNSLEKAIYIEF